MKPILVPIDKGGRVVLPKDVRDELAIHPGDLLMVSVHGTEVSLRPKRQTAGLRRKGRALVFSSVTDEVMTNEMVETLLREERRASELAATRGLPSRKRQP